MNYGSRPVDARLGQVQQMTFIRQTDTEISMFKKEKRKCNFHIVSAATVKIFNISQISLHY